MTLRGLFHKTLISSELLQPPSTLCSQLGEPHIQFSHVSAGTLRCVGHSRFSGHSCSSRDAGHLLFLTALLSVREDREEHFFE